MEWAKPIVELYAPHGVQRFQLIMLRVTRAIPSLMNIFGQPDVQYSASAHSVVDARLLGEALAAV
jgi:hypothetical protein